MANPTPMWGTTYAVSEAERGRLIPLDMSTITEYPSSGRGKFAVLTCDINTMASVASAANNVAPNSLMVMSSSFGYGAVTFNAPVSTTPFRIVEVYNNSGTAVYFLANTTATYDQLTATGIPIGKNGGFYSLERIVEGFSLGITVAGSDLRVMGHYTA